VPQRSAAKTEVRPVNETTIQAARPDAMFTRENLTVLFKCSHGELGRLLARKMAPLPVRIDGVILWYVDEVQNATAQVQRTLERWKQRR
jgi:hypothetical protein